MLGGPYAPHPCEAVTSGHLQKGACTHTQTHTHTHAPSCMPTKDKLHRSWSIMALYPRYKSVHLLMWIFSYITTVRSILVN